MSLFRPQPDGFENHPFLYRIAASIDSKENPVDIVACFSPVNAPRNAIINRCRDVISKRSLAGRHRKLHILAPFCASSFMSIGNLSVALVWHLYKSLPESVKTDEKVIYRLGKISVSLPSLSDIFSPILSRTKSETEQCQSVSGAIFSPENKSSVSSTFSVCEQIQDLSNSFGELGSIISTLGDFDAVVIPVLDADLCQPHQSVALLYTLKNIICSEHIACIFLSDKNLLKNAIGKAFNSSRDDFDAEAILYSYFDDWVTTPAPSLKLVMQNALCTLTEPEREDTMYLLTASGILPLLPDPQSLEQSMNRFFKFTSYSSAPLNRNEYGTVALLFLLSTITPEKLSTLSQLPDLSGFISKARAMARANLLSSPNAFRTHPDDRTSLLPGTKKEGASDFPITYFELLYKGDKSMSLFFANVPQNLNDQRLADLICQIVPFI